MDGLRAKKTRSSTRQRHHTDDETGVNINDSSNPFDELLHEHTANDHNDHHQLYLNYNDELENSDENSRTMAANRKMSTKNNTNINRMVHFGNERNTSNRHENNDQSEDQIGNNDDNNNEIPSMLITENLQDEKYHSGSGSSAAMRMGFGNLNIRHSGPMDLVSDGFFGVIDEEQQFLDEDEEQGNGMAFSSTSADLRAAIVSNWLTDHYEPQDNISLPRSVLYDHYLEFCQSQGTEPVNSATFGKIIRSVFPTLRTRRLGTRGNSKYHYFGIGLKSDFLGNSEYSAIYSQYSRPPPSRPRASKKDSQDSSFAYSNGNFSSFSNMSSGAAASHVYSASSSCKDNDSSASGSRRNVRRSRSSRTSSRQQQQHQQQYHQHLDDEQNAEALLLGHHGMISSASGNSGAFRTLSSPNYDDFGHFLEQICTPVYSNVPPHVAFDSVQAFSLVYQQHIIDLLRAISSHEFSVVEGLSEMFWMNFPPEMLTCLHCDESLRIVAIADDYLYQVLIHTLIPDVLEPIPIGITQNVRQFSKYLEGILQRTLQMPIPASIIEVKLDSARRFCQVLRRRTSLSHLTQAIRSILCNAEQSQQMLLDWGQIDFQGIREQCDWIMKMKEGFLPWIETSFRTYLQDGVSLHVWSGWIESITDQCISSEQAMGLNVEDACSVVVLRWTFYSSMIMRDLTLRSAGSFGSFHLLNLLFNEYLLYSVEKRLDDHRRSVGLMAFWPSNNSQPINGDAESLDNRDSRNNVATTNTNTVEKTDNSTVPVQGQQNFAFDDFFRKSAVLGPVSSPLVHPATRNAAASTNNNNSSNSANTNGINNFLSSPLGTKTIINQQVPNKENNAEYNLI